MVRVFIASPYSKGDTEKNVMLSMKASDSLINYGLFPFCPLLFHWQHVKFPQTEDVWKNQDLEWLPLCKAVLRLEGESTGADEEVATANDLHIPVFYNIPDLIKWYES